MNPRPTYYRFTTGPQRKLLFETWEATGSVTQACRKAHVGRGTFYKWRARFEREGYAGLEEFKSRAPHQVHRKPEAIETRVVELRQAHPEWGKFRIADEMAKEHQWVRVISANTVRRILRAAGLWSERAGPKKKSVRRSATPNDLDRPPI